MKIRKHAWKKKPNELGLLIPHVVMQFMFIITLYDHTHIGYFLCHVH